MNDIDDLQQQVDNLKSIVESLVAKQGLVISSYLDGEVLTPDEEEETRKQWLDKMHISAQQWADASKKVGGKQ